MIAAFWAMVLMVGTAVSYVKLVPVFWVAALPAASLTSTAIVYELPLDSPAMSEAA